MTDVFLTTERLACLVVAHNLGDAVIQSHFMRRLVQRRYAHGYLVWTRPQCAFLFEDLTDTEVICSQFPVGTNKQFSFRSAIAFARAAREIRRRRPSVTLDLIGDVRDRLFGRIAGGRRHLHLGWHADHPFNRLIRNPFGPGRPLLMVPPSVPNVYDAHRLLLDVIAPNVQSPSTGRIPALLAYPKGVPSRFGLHPFASQECKLWPATHWRALIENLLSRSDVALFAYGAPQERKALETLFAPYLGQITLVTGDMRSFAEHVSTLDVMIGLDSFSIHMAELRGVRGIMINAGNPADLWSVPSGVTIAKSGGCANYPCFNVPACMGTDDPYACVRSIDVKDVLAAIMAPGRVAT